MNRNLALKILNPLIALLMVSVFAAAFGREALPYWAFEVFHKGAAGLLLLGMLLHLALNWGWIKASYLGRK